MDLTVTDHLLSTTRSVRKRLDLTRPVPREPVLQALRQAVQAPTGSNQQGWRWLVVEDAERRAALADIYRRGSAAYFERAPRTVTASTPAAEREQAVRVRDSASYLRDVLHQVPVHVVPCIQGRVDGADNAQAAPFYGSVYPAVWSFMLALRARGLGTVLTTLHLGLEREAAELLGIPDDVSQVGLLPVAYFTGDDFRPARRPPVEEITYWDRWGATG